MSISSTNPRVRIAAIAAVGLLAGCAGRRGIVHNGVSTERPPELQTLAELQPPVALPTPATRPAAPAPIDALEAYARGRDAILKNQKTIAIKELNAAIEIDADSAVVWRDLGYAQLGMDDRKAAAAFRHARGLDPTDADSRLQLARLLLNDKQNDDAVTELRLARLTDEYAESGGLAAVVDLLLGQCLEGAHFRSAALECYENVLAVVDEGEIDLRGRPELGDVLQRPGILVLRTADLATQCGRYSRAIELYERLQKQEPQSAVSLELRIARAELAAGDRGKATRRAVDFVLRSKASFLSLTLFDELFAPYGGSIAALAEIKKIVPAGDREYGDLLGSHLLLSIGDTAGAIKSVQRFHRNDFDGGVIATAWLDRPGLPVVRQTVHAYRAAGRDEDLLRELLSRTYREPRDWHVWERGWETLSQIAQPHPLTPEKLIALDLSHEPRGVAAARAFVVSTLYAKSGRTTAEKKWADIARASVAAKDARDRFDVAAAEASPPVDLTEPDVDSSKEMAVLLDDYRDDEELLTTFVAAVLRDGQKSMVLDAFASVQAARPADPVIAIAYAQVLAAADRRSDAIGVLEKAAAASTSASVLYAVASQFSGLGDEKSAERVLRKAYAADAALPSVCNDLGYLLTDQGRELPFAEQLLTRAATAEPDNAAYLDSLGWLLYKRSKFESAARRLEEAVAAAEPTDPVVLDHAGDALYQARQAEQAAGRWQQAVQAIERRGTNDPQLRLRIKQKLDQLENKTPVGVAPVANVDNGG